MDAWYQTAVKASVDSSITLGVSPVPSYTGASSCYSALGVCTYITLFNPHFCYRIRRRRDINCSVLWSLDS